MEKIQRLESIDNAKPSKALELIDSIREYSHSLTMVNYLSMNFDLDTIKQYILKAQEQEKVLEILFKKQVDLGWLWYCIHECINSLNEYNKKMPIEKFKLTQEEFDLLKRYFENE